MLATDTRAETGQRHINEIRLRDGRTVQIRRFAYTDQAYRAAVAIRNAINPDMPRAVADWKHRDARREPRYLFRRYVAEHQRRVVAVGAYGHTPWSYSPDKYFVSILVHPRMQQRGIGSGFYNFLMRRVDRRRPAKLVASTRENRARAIRFLQTRGFRTVMRQEVSRMESAGFDESRYATKLERVRATGIEIKTLAELMVEDPAWKRRTYELEWQCLQDVPSADGFTRRSLETFEKQTLENPCLLTNAWFIAVDGDRYVGLTVLWRNLATDSLLETGLTGVIRSHRRRGIATALKVRAIKYAQTHGNAAIDTDNEENNPMFQLNLDLGFKPQAGFLELQKRMDMIQDQRTESGVQYLPPI